MSNSDKAAEPTMDEILASIRKIISEEPEGSDAAPANEKPVKAAAAEPSTAGAIWSSGGHSADDDLSDILDQPAGAPPHEVGPPRQSEQQSARGAGRPPAPSSRPTFGQRPAPPPIDAEDVPAPEAPPPAPTALSRPGEMADSPFGLPLPVQPMSGEGPPVATPPLPAPPMPEPGPAPALRRSDAPKSPPPVGAPGAPNAPSLASAPLAQPPKPEPMASAPKPEPMAPPEKAAAVAPPPKANSPASALKMDPVAPGQEEKPSIGFTLADRLRNFGLDGGSDGADSDPKPGEPPEAEAEERKKPDLQDEQEEAAKPETPVPFAMRATRIDTPEFEEAPGLDDESEPDAPEVAVKFASVSDHADADAPATPIARAGNDEPTTQSAAPSQPPPTESIFGAPPRGAENMPRPAAPTDPVDPAARENAIRRGIFGMPALADENSVDDAKGAPPAADKVTKADGPPPFAGFDEPIGKRALEILAEPPTSAEPAQLAEPTPDDPSPAKAVAANEAEDGPGAETGPTIPLAGAAGASDDEALQDAGPEGPFDKKTMQTALPAPGDEVAKPAADEIGQGAAGRSLEDTVSALLRPMLRDWLDTNMPGIVEKALKDELAPQDVDPSKSDGPKDAKD